ncbi:MAG TPA: type II toxin-antitoxin system ParD family antitoxin [Acidobacteriaceae bacterium]|nr:type II toxin-antitoxin system ParD family antitoxin [Acidobacteriaceae bacterium]
MTKFAIAPYSSSMPTMNISLPEPLKKFIEEQISSGTYSSASEYVRELVRADQERREQEEMEHLLRNALRSTGPVVITPRMVDQVRQTLRSRDRRRRGAKP